MKINIFGLGYVGCVTAACLANEGHVVNGMDVDTLKVNMINKGRSPIVEPALDDVINKAIDSRRLVASAGGVEPADISIVCVGTPSNENGSLQLSYVRRVAEQIGDYLAQTDSYHAVNVRSTVLPGTVEDVVIPILESRSKKKAGQDFGVCMNPEFIREGTSIHDYYNPPMTVIGELDKKSGEIVSQIYKNIRAPLIRTTIKTAEIVKYVCNSYHALKVVFANEVGNLCKKLDIDSHDVMDIFCTDTKLNISPSYFKPGFAFGGSCLPKDLRALTYKAKEMDVECHVLDSILRSNSHHVETAFKLLQKTGKKKVGVLGLSFKHGTDDLRESPMVELVEKLIGKGYEVCIYDKEVSLAKIFGSNKKYIEKAIPHISSLLCKSVEDVIRRSQVIIVGKNDVEFKGAVSRVSNGKVVIDLVRISSHSERKKKSYEGICW